MTLYICDCGRLLMSNINTTIYSTISRNEFLKFKIGKFEVEVFVDFLRTH